MTEEPITPNPLHFVRNHGGIPIISAAKYTVHLDGLVKRPTTLKLADLQNEDAFPRQSTLATIQCSGTRRIEQINEYAGEGDEMINAPWAEGAIGTATWTGVSLKKVIKHCGGLIEGAQHLEFYGADTYFKQVSPSHLPAKADYRANSLPGSGAELLGISPVVESQSQRSHPCMGDERPAAPEDSRVSFASGRARLHRRSFREVAIPDKSTAGTLPRASPVTRISLLQRPSREAQPALHERHPDPGDARQ